MDEAALARIAPDLVRVAWGRVVRSAEPLGGGMNSATALLQLADGSFVAKWVPTASAAALTSGCEVAQLLARHGLVTGEPLPTSDGRLAFPVGQGAVALLRFVAGEPLTGDTARDQEAMAVTLARVHAAETTTSSTPYLSDEVAELVQDVEPWIRPTVRAVLDEYGRLPTLTWGVLHADPAPEAFLRQESGVVALIDWTAAARGPVLYDVASAVMYLGGRAHAEAFWNAYVSLGPAPAVELEEHFDAFSRFRAAVQAAYFSMRVATGDATGIADQRENWKGLRDAEQMLRANGVEPVVER
jgi:Ser/Thr protein kinase RdoA (MazF antagonist)